MIVCLGKSLYNIIPTRTINLSQRVPNPIQAGPSIVNPSQAARERIELLQANLSKKRPADPSVCSKPAGGQRVKGFVPIERLDQIWGLWVWGL